VQGARVKPGGGGLADRLQGLKIAVEARSIVAEGTAGNELAPLDRPITEFLELLGRKLASRQGGSCLGVERFASACSGLRSMA